MLSNLDQTLRRRELYGKALKEVIFDTDRGVTVTFEDGTAAAGSNVAGAEGAKSRIRRIYSARRAQPPNQRRTS